MQKAELRQKSFNASTDAEEEEEEECVDYDDALQSATHLTSMRWEAHSSSSSSIQMSGDG
jgi:hypothetical protein